jgi:3-oxoacyl-[acyl-carrier-protein] synthase II
MKHGGERVVVTGLGLVTPMGVGVETFWSGIERGVSTAASIERFDVTGWPTRFACQVPEGFEGLAATETRKAMKLMGRASQFAAVAAALALDDAGLPRRAADPERAGVVLGVGGVGLHDLDHTRTLGRVAAEIGAGASPASIPAAVERNVNPLLPLKLLPNISASHISIAHDLRGESSTVCTACTSATQALGEAFRRLRAGDQDWMLSGGTDAMVNPTGLLGFGLLGVLSRRNDSPSTASRPFDRSRDGFVMGEGAALLVLERLEHARARRARIYAEVLGYGCAADAYRITDEPPDGRGSVLAMRRALADADLRPEQLDHINAHGTGTRMNDLTEARALAQVFGPAARTIPVTSTKSQVGHLVAAAGGVETAASVLSLHHQVLPPSINVREQDPEVDLTLAGATGRPAAIRFLLKNSFGFGGQNASLVLGRWEGSA